MNRATLTFLGFSSAFALTLLIVNPAKAGTISILNESVAGETQTQSVKTSLSQTSLSQTSFSQDNSSDTIGELAIAKFGCDCAGCRNRISQMLQSQSK